MSRLLAELLALNLRRDSAIWGRSRAGVWTGRRRPSGPRECDWADVWIEGAICSCLCPCDSTLAVIYMQTRPIAGRYKPGSPPHELNHDQVTASNSNSNSNNDNDNSSLEPAAAAAASTCSLLTHTHMLVSQLAS